MERICEHFGIVEWVLGISSDMQNSLDTKSTIIKSWRYSNRTVNFESYRSHLSETLTNMLVFPGMILNIARENNW